MRKLVIDGGDKPLAITQTHDEWAATLIACFDGAKRMSDMIDEAQFATMAGNEDAARALRSLLTGYEYLTHSIANMIDALDPAVGAEVREFMAEHDHVQ